MREMQRLTGAVIKLPEQVSNLIFSLPQVYQEPGNVNHKPQKTCRPYFCSIFTFNRRAPQLERRRVCTSLDLSTRPSPLSGGFVRWWPGPPEELPPLRPPSSPMAAGPAPCPRYLPPPQTSHRHSSRCGRNLFKMAVFDSALGRPTPDYPLLQTGLSKKPQLASKTDIKKKHILASSPPQKA